MDRLEAMGAFVQVAELRGFSAAARRLGTTASRVTRLVAALEEQLAARLLQRTTRSVQLTEAGARYLERARRVLAEVGEAEAEARADRSRPAGRFVVAAPTVFGRREVAPLLCRFLAQHAAVRGVLTLSDRVVSLVEEGVDLAVRIGHLEDSSLRVRAVGSTRRVLVASPGYLAAHPAPRLPEALAGHALLQLTPLSPTLDWRFRETSGRKALAGAGPRRRLREVRVTAPAAFASNSADAVVARAEGDGGIALVLSYQAREGLAAGRLVRVLPRWEPPPLPIQLVFPAARHESAALRAFIDFVVARARWTFA